MEDTFVKEIGIRLINNHGEEHLQNVLVIIPSQRIGLHLKKELAEQFSGTRWLPEINSIDHFVSKLSSETPVDDLDAIFELYQSYIKVFEKPDDFDTFLTWGKQIINDFNEIDKYLLESKDVFKNLQAIKEIESWSFNADELTETQKKFMEFWEKLGELYQRYNEDLAKKGLCTKSSIYKSIATDPITHLAKLKYDKIYVVGFNALSLSEETMFKYLVNAQQCEIIWDADQYYVNDKEQEAGSFIRKYLKWSEAKKEEIPSGLTTVQKEIHLYGANSNIGQTLVASSILSSDLAFSTKKSALIFSDESLLRPMLNVLPNSIDKMNVAMGYPLNASNSYSLLDQIFATLRNVERYQQKSSLYYKDYENIFHHELIQLLVDHKKIDLSSVEHKVNKENYTYIPKQVMSEALKLHFSLFDLFFYQKETNVTTLIARVIILFEEIRDILLMLNVDLIEKEAVLVILSNLKKLNAVLEKYPIVKSPESALLLVKQLIKTGKVSFFGEPLKGLQVLGLLETRGLDFENLILLSCNEEILPAASYSQSLMPYDLRKYFGLPTKDDKEAMFAYYFYRLLHRSKNIHFIYNDGAPDGMSTNEVSRYLLQIQNELGSDKVKIIHHDGDDVKNSIDLDSFAEVGGSKDLEDRVRHFIDQGLSASAINTFNKCPRDFFFNYLLRPNETDKVEENIESSTFGTIVHEVLEELYTVEGSLITQELIDDMLSSYEGILKAHFKKVFPSENFKSGKNLLQYESAKYSISQFLKKEQKYIQENGVIKILSLEKTYRKDVVCNTPYGEITVQLKGNIDRVDQVGNKIRIIDYKTGKVTDNLVLKDKMDAMYSYSMQLLVYLYLFSGNEDGKDVESGILSMKDISAGVQVLKRKVQDERGVGKLDAELKDSFENYIQSFICELFESDYVHNTSSKYCSMC